MLKKSFASYTLFFLLLNINLSYSANENIFIAVDKVYSMFPTFNKNNFNYALRDCDNKNIDFKISFNGRNFNKKLAFKYGDMKNLKIGEYKYRFRCLENAWKVIDYNYQNFNNSKGYILGKFYHSSSDMIDCSKFIKLCDKAPYASTLYLVDLNGVPIWYRTFSSNNNFTGYFIDGNKINLLYLNYDKLPPQSNDKPSGSVLAIDITNGKIIKRITPYEILDKEKKFPPLDFHAFHESDKYYYFISYDDKIVYKKPIFLNSFTDGNTEVEAEYDFSTRKKLCLSENSYLERRARIIRSDKNGLVNTSFAFPIYDNNSITLNYRSDSDIKCEIDYHHPNWVSTEDDKTVVFSLFNQFIGGLDLQKNKIIWYLTDNNDSTLLAKGLDPKLKINAVDDPLGGPDKTHSGSLYNNKLYLYDNRSKSNEVGRGVIYNIDFNKRVALLDKTFVPLNKKCLSTDKGNGKVICNTLRMGNISRSNSGYTIVNWGDRGINHNVFSLYNNQGKILLDVTYGKYAFPIYKNEFISASELDKYIILNTNLDNNTLFFNESKKIFS